MKFLKSFSLFEAIKLSDARKVTEIFLKSGGKERYNEVFKGQDRLYYDLEEAMDNPKTELSVQIESELEKNGYTMLDYYAGTAKKNEDDKNLFKIQKLLVKWKLDELKSKMDSDPIRSGTKSKSKKVVISRHGIDLAGVSTGRGWTSCKNLKGGMNAKYVFTEAEVGALVAYLIEADDLNIQKPIQRISIPVYINEKDPTKVLLYPESKGYGNYNKTDFFNFVLKWVKDFNKHLNPAEGQYRRSDKCYTDENRPINYKSTQEKENIGDNIADFIRVNAQGDILIKYQVDNKNYILEDLYESIDKENVDENTLSKYMEILEKEGFINLLIDYINKEDNTKTEFFIDKNLKKMSVILKGLGKNISGINDEKSMVIAKKYYQNIPESAKGSLFKIVTNGPFFLWFRDKIEKSGLIGPDFQSIAR
jgi:hypothetical protein